MRHPRAAPARQSIAEHRYHGDITQNKCRSTHIRSPWCSGKMSSGHVPAWCTAHVEVDSSGCSPVPRRADVCDVGRRDREPIGARVPAVLQLQHSKSVLLRRRPSYLESLLEALRAMLRPTASVFRHGIFNFVRGLA